MAKVLKNVKVEWAKVFEPDTKFTPVYSVDAVLDQQHVKQLQEDGLGDMIKEKDGNKVFRFKKKAISKDGKPLPPPKVVDMKKQPFTELLGNGTVCNIAYEPFDYEFAGRKGKTARLLALQVVDHVPFVPKVEDLFEGEEDSEDDENPFT